MRVSSYNIYLNFKNHTEQMLLVHGYRGSFDIIDKPKALTLMGAVEDPILLNSLDEETFSVLLRRGYITEMTEDEEKAALKSVCDTIKDIDRKTHAITIIPTYNCNFRCEYCFEQNIQKNGTAWLKKVMSFDMVDSIFAKINNYLKTGNKIPAIFLFGGEPLLTSNKEIVTYICDKASQLNIPIYAVSNGYNLEDYFDLLTKYNFGYVQITLDGSENEHNSRRFLVNGKGSYQKIVSNINDALERGIRIVLRTNINQKNINEINGLVDYYKQMGWTDKKNFGYYFKSTLRCFEEIGNAASDVELMNIISSSNIGDINKFQFNSMYSPIYQKLSYMLKTGGYAPLHSSYCGATSGMLTIDPYGDIYPCWDVLTNHDFIVGKVNMQTEDFDMNEVYNQWQERTSANIPECSVCEYALFCGGGCAAQACFTDGNIYHPYCEDYKLIFNEIAADLCEKEIDISENINIELTV